jgi:cutinase
MRVLNILAFVSVVAATPQGKGGQGKGGKGTINPGGTPGNRGPNTENDVVSGKCQDILFIMARASTEAGNMVCSIGLL